MYEIYTHSIFCCFALYASFVITSCIPWESIEFEFVMITQIFSFPSTATVCEDVDERSEGYRTSAYCG